MDESIWQAGMPPSSFETPFGVAQSTENWEDWLRWDPAVDSTPPDNDFSRSGSSKNDSPFQDPVYPTDIAFDKIRHDDTLAPPLVVGEDTFDLDAGTSLENDAFAFGARDHATAPFNFDTISQGLPAVTGHDSGNEPWSLPSNTVATDVDSLPMLHPGAPETVALSAPSTATSPTFQTTPESSNGKGQVTSSQPSPDPPKRRGGRKRKAELEEQIEQENGGESQDGEGPPVKKASHNVIEKRYRNNLNDKIVELRNSVPSLRAMGRTHPGNDSEDLEGLTPAHKLNKATVMAKATEYIRHLERRNKTIADEMAALQSRLASVEAAFGKSRSRQHSTSSSPPSGTVRPRQLSSASQMASQAYLSVPQQAQSPYAQPQYMQHQAPPSYARPPNPPAQAQNHPQQFNARGGLMNKVMLGGMAGVMLMEGFGEHQSGPDSSALGLGAIPGLHLIGRGEPGLSFTPAARLSHAALPLLKLTLILGAMLYLLLPLLTYSPRRKQPVRHVARLPQAPSLASPVEVRRKAWLTAIQSVWVPKHFLLEVVAVTSRMVRLSVRRVIGPEIFASFTGTSKEDEAARIKAWDIAIDAQLAGGDAEVSYYRLLLTLMASGTLPDSPTRLMQKAVHFRVFFWEVANAGYGNLIMFKQFTEKVGKFYWECARRQQRELVAADASRRDESIDLLPDHLARLLELDCDDVLSDEMIQRAWNLAWNKPSAHGAVPNAARDLVVMDHAIRSPLDAVAAWYSNMLIDEILAEAFLSVEPRVDTEAHLALALDIAPPASGTQSRAFAAKAVLSTTHRESNIVAALDALPHVSSPSSNGMNLVNHGPAAPEVHNALTLSKLTSLSATAAAAPAVRRNVGDILSGLSLPPRSFTLLTAVAAYQLLETMNATRSLSLSASQGLEDLACSLRIWVGTSAGRQAGLDGRERAAIVEGCIEVARKFGGWDEHDSGYGSHTVSESPSPVRSRPDSRDLIVA